APSPQVPASSCNTVALRCSVAPLPTSDEADRGAPPAVCLGMRFRQYSCSRMAFTHDVIRSLHDPGLYREAAGRSLPRSLLPLGRLALLTALALTTAATLWLSSLWSEHVAPVLDALPTITIRNGVATVEGPQPWVRRVVRDQAGHDWVIVLDTTGRTD